MGGDEAGAGDLDGAVALQNSLQEYIDANEEGAVGSSEPQPSTSGYIPVAAPLAPDRYCVPEFVPIYLGIVWS